MIPATTTGLTKDSGTMVNHNAHLVKYDGKQLSIVDALQKHRSLKNEVTNHEYSAGMYGVILMIALVFIPIAFAFGIILAILLWAVIFIGILCLFYLTLRKRKRYSSRVRDLEPLLADAIRKYMKDTYQVTFPHNNVSRIIDRRTESMLVYLPNDVVCHVTIDYSGERLVAFHSGQPEVERIEVRNTSS